MSQAKTRRPLIALASLALGLALGAGACSRPHLSSNYGQSYAAWFGAQHVNSKAAVSELTRKNLDGLDAQEAAMVSKSYRRSTAGKGGEESSGGRLLMIGAPRGGGEAYVPPPSVPGGQ